MPRPKNNPRTGTGFGGTRGPLNRRDFVSCLGGTAVTWPLAARAQQPVMPVIGWLDSVSVDFGTRNLPAFRQSLGEEGYIEASTPATYSTMLSPSGVPRIDAESEVSSRCGHLRLLPASSEATPRLAAITGNGLPPCCRQGHRSRRPRGHRSRHRRPPPHSGHAY
jgi:hypothetical protein